MRKIIFFLTLIHLSVFAISATALPSTPICKDKKEVMQINNSQVLTWREFMDDKFSARAFIQGTLVTLMEDRQKHIHFEVDLDQNLTTTDDRIEVIYNTKYGELNTFKEGDEIMACGDFIVDKYSPHKAVVHWLHTSPKPQVHEHGFISINGTLFGVVPEDESRK